MAMVTKPATKHCSETYLVKILIHTYLRFSFIFHYYYIIYIITRSIEHYLHILLT